ncbi:hypothetical protein ACIPJS_31185 [Streptomyces sp. NPDC086783]|uniref:hypothetical protein n=1 Tax=Streptomyces sp. NPDC086783 TaxID=3365758 RepID=UPI0038003FD2
MSRAESRRLRLTRRATAWGLTLPARGLELVYWGYALHRLPDDPFPLLFPLAITFAIWVHRSRVAEVMRTELGRDAFPGTAPATPAGSERQARVARAITWEQHAGVALYDAHRPFVCAGKPHEPWSFAMQITPAGRLGRLNGGLPDGYGGGLPADDDDDEADGLAVRTLAQCLRTWLARPEQAPPDAPLLSVRELGSTDRLSLFQEMDVSRYVKTVEDRIASGVREALRRSGCETGRFEQNIVNVAAGGRFIGQMSGGTAVGRISRSAVTTGSGGAVYGEGDTG